MDRDIYKRCMSQLYQFSLYVNGWDGGEGVEFQHETIRQAKDFTINALEAGGITNIILTPCVDGCISVELIGQSPTTVLFNPSE